MTPTRKTDTALESKMPERRHGYETLQRQLTALKKELDVNTAITKRLEGGFSELQRKTEHVVTAFDAAEGAFKVLEFVGKLAKPLIWVGLAGGVAIAGWQGFKSFLRTL